MKTLAMNEREEIPTVTETIISANVDKKSDRGYQATR